MLIPQELQLSQKIADSVAFFESHEKTTDMYHTSLILNDLRESFSGMKFYICIPY